MSELHPGVIFDIARAGGMEIPDRHGDKVPCRCPFHDDRRASAFLSVNNVFYCSVCTPNGGLSAKQFAARVGVPWPTKDGDLRAVAPARRCPASIAPPGLAPSVAAEVWAAACARARARDARDAEAVRYLRRRGLADALELGHAGLLGAGMQLPPSVRSWPARGYRVAAAVCNLEGAIVSLHARRTRDGAPKTHFPEGRLPHGVLLANAHGVAVLAQREQLPGLVVFGEGLTDHLALSLAHDVPVLSPPGTGFFAASVGPWTAHKRVALAVDCDEATEALVPALSDRLRLFGATDVIRVRWPAGCKDACAVLERHGLGVLCETVEHALSGGGR